MQAGIVRLEPGSTKNDDGRTFPFSLSPEPPKLLQSQQERTHAVHKVLGQLVPCVFHRKCIGLSIFCVRHPRPHSPRFLTNRSSQPRTGRCPALRRDEAGRSNTESIYRRYAVASEADLSEGVQSSPHFQSPQAVTKKIAVLKRRRAHGKQAASEG